MIVAGNWKMFTGPDPHAVAGLDAIVCPPYTRLAGDCVDADFREHGAERVHRPVLEFQRRRRGGFDTQLIFAGASKDGGVALTARGILFRVEAAFAGLDLFGAETVKR